MLFVATSDKNITNQRELLPGHSIVELVTNDVRKDVIVSSISLATIPSLMFLTTSKFKREWHGT